MVDFHDGLNKLSKPQDEDIILTEILDPNDPCAKSNDMDGA